jgi:hypothetical protein
MVSSARFPIKFEPAYALLSKSLFISPADSYIEIAGDTVSVRMAWAFRAKFDRAQVSGTSIPGSRIALTRGVHGWAGRWLVNGAGDGIVAIELEPRQRAYVMGFPIRLRELKLSVENPAALAAALAS